MQIRDRMTLPAPLLVMFAVALGVQIALFLFPFVVFETWIERAHFGDSFGFVSTIFSGFALCGVIYSHAVQVREQSRQRRDARSVVDSQIASTNRLATALDAQTQELRELRTMLSDRLRLPE